MNLPGGPTPEEAGGERPEGGQGPDELGDELEVYFTSFRYRTGDHFETIWKPDKPFTFRLNDDEVIPAG